MQTDRRLTLALVAPLVALYLILGFRFVFPHCIDDAAIYFRYVEHWRAGHGFAYNPGAEPTYGASGVLYLLLLTALSYTGLDLPLLARGIGLIAGAACVVLAYGIGAALYRSRLAAFGGALMALLAPLFLIWSVAGLETSLHLALQLGVALAFLRGRAVWCGALCALTILSKLDGGFVVLAVGLVALARDRRPPWKIILTAAAVLFPALAALWLYFGTPVPISMIAKAENAGIGGAGRRWMIELLIKGNMGELCLAALPFILFSGREWERLTLPLWAGLYVAGYAIFPSPEPYHWYAAPPAFVLFLMAGHGAGLLAARALESRRPAAIAAVAALALLFGAREARYIRSSHRLVKTYNEFVEATRVEVGRWLGRHMTPEEVVATGNGWPAHLSGARVIDTTGLTNLRFAGRSIWEVLSEDEYPHYVAGHMANGRPFELPPDVAGRYVAAAHFTKNAEASEAGPWTIYARSDLWEKTFQEK